MSEPDGAGRSIEGDGGYCWARHQRLGYYDERLTLWLDLSCMEVNEVDLGLAAGPMAERLAKAFAGMDELEAGAIANVHENRRVGHYWLRAPELCPDPEAKQAIEQAQAQVRQFVASVHDGSVRPQRAERFRHLLVIGIGGSVLGPQLVADALSNPTDPLTAHFLDNTDPDGIHRVLAQLSEELDRTLTVIISKSGGTKETRNGMLHVQAAYQARGLEFGRHAVAVTGSGSALASFAASAGFLATLPMWDWVGGRTSVTSAVGLLPAALQGIDIEELLRGARWMDEATRRHVVRENPAALLAAAWFTAGAGRGDRDMVMLPYKDRLVLLSRYLQQLVMESLGKRFDLDGNVSQQGIVVYGNKGSTDQHAYLQQLLDGLENAFVTFIEVLRDEGEAHSPFEVEPGITAGDYLTGFLLGTRRALRDRDRQSICITIEQVDALRLGAMIALFERAVGLYAILININPYHQPAVESGKRAAAAVLELQRQAIEVLVANPDQLFSAEELATAVGSDDAESLFAVLRHLSANPGRGVRAVRPPGARPWELRFQSLS